VGTAFLSRRSRRVFAALVAASLIATACADDDDITEAEPPTTVADAGDANGDAANGDAANGDEVNGDAADAGPWPAPDWEAVDPADAGVDPAVLEELAARAEVSDSDCLVVTRDGQLVGEWYWNDTGPDDEREAFSVTKSITAVLVGIAADEGHLDLDQPASDFIEEWVGTPSEAITIRNLLANDSGRFQTAESDYVQLAGEADDKTAFAIGLDQQHEIGVVWVYNNAAIQVLEAVLERATGTDVGTFADEHLFGPLGMDTTMNTDPVGNTLTFMGAQMNCRDMARFGLLALRDGEWDGEQVVSSDFMAQALEPSTELNEGYGLLWWLFGDDPDALIETAPGQTPMTGGDIVAYAALGLGGQVILVVPEHDLVLTRMSAEGGAFGTPEVLELARTQLVVD
jgi:CubicO group peptidase (beta-lactamase class C family)